MVTETDQTSEVTTEVPEQTSQETQVDSTSEATKEVAAQDSTKGEQVEKPAYTPNYKLKVYDEEKELEDKFLKDLIKDPESEKKVKEIAQKYLGFDTVKSRHEKVKSEYQTFKEQAEPVVEYLSLIHISEPTRPY